MSMVATALQNFQSHLDGALAVNQERYWTDLVSMGLVRLGAPWAVQKVGRDEEAGDRKDLRICDQRCQQICALDPLWLCLFDCLCSLSPLSLR